MLEQHLGFKASEGGEASAADEDEDGATAGEETGAAQTISTVTPGGSGSEGADSDIDIDMDSEV